MYRKTLQPHPAGNGPQTLFRRRATCCKQLSSNKHFDYKVTKNFANKDSYPAKCYNFATK